MKLFVKKKTLAWNSTFFVPKLFHKLLPFFCCFLAKTEENTTVLFWKCSSKQTSRCTLLSTIEVSPEKKNAVFFSKQNFSIRSPKKKLPNFVCLCKMPPITEHAEAEKKRLSQQHLNWRKQAHEPQ